MDYYVPDVEEEAYIASLIPTEKTFRTRSSDVDQQSLSESLDEEISNDIDFVQDVKPTSKRVAPRKNIFSAHSEEVQSLFKKLKQASPLSEPVSLKKVNISFHLLRLDLFLIDFITLKGEYPKISTIALVKDSSPEALASMLDILMESINHGNRGSTRDLIHYKRVNESSRRLSKISLIQNFFHSNNCFNGFVSLVSPISSPRFAI
jgi:hypothetical protein